MNGDEERPLTLGIDQGGHSSRALVFDSAGLPVVAGQVAVAERRVGEDRVEQDPEELVGSVRGAIDAALSELGGRTAEVTAAGLATQRSSVVCWDRDSGEALSPVLSWQDRRAAAWIERHVEADDEIRVRTGLRLSPHYGASKLRWCLDELAEVREAHRDGRLACGPLASFLLFRLLEERPHAIDPANGGRTLLMSLETLDWDPALLERFGIDRELLPRCVPTLHRYGELRIGHASGDLRVPVRALNGDQSAALFAWGRPDRSTVYVNIGTGAFLQRLGDGPPRPHPRLLASVVLSTRERREPMWVREGTVNGAASALDWLADRLGEGPLEPRLDDWLRRAEEEPAEMPLFLNGISGLGSPFWVPRFPSRFVGRGARGAGWQLAAAVVDSIAFLIRANLDEMRAPGIELRRVVASGGLSQLDGLCQRIADLAGVEVLRPRLVEATTSGIGWLAAGRPAGWSRLDAERAFSPRPNEPLLRRWKAWRRAMPTPGPSART